MGKTKFPAKEGIPPLACGILFVQASRVLSLMACRISLPLLGIIGTVSPFACAIPDLCEALNNDGKVEAACRAIEKYKNELTLKVPTS